MNGIFRTCIDRYPDDKVTIIILCNREDIVVRDIALNTGRMVIEK